MFPIAVKHLEEKRQRLLMRRAHLPEGGCRACDAELRQIAEQIRRLQLLTEPQEAA